MQGNPDSGALSTGRRGSAAANPVMAHSARLRAAVVRLGIECLDREWRGTAAEYRFRCRRNHVFSRCLHIIAHPASAGCPECALQSRTERLRAAAQAVGVQWLDAQYLGPEAVHRFACPAGHQWGREGKRALTRTGCPQCAREAGRRRKLLADGLERLKRTAAARGGQCLATAFAGVQHVYAFRCAQGHAWEALGTDVLRRTWCPECARLRKVEGYRHRDGLVRLQHKAVERGGLCLSDCYTGVGDRYRFRCAEGHEWEATGARILRGAWCGICVYAPRRLGLAAAHEAAKARGGQCLSTVYHNAATKLHWLCHRGHSWQAALSTIRAGHWCSECAHMNQITNPNSKAWKRYRVAREKG